MAESKTEKAHRSRRVWRRKTDVTAALNLAGSDAIAWQWRNEQAKRLDDIEREYDEAMQWRDWDTCDYLAEEREQLVGQEQAKAQWN